MGKLSRLGMLGHEIGTLCNLTAEHTRCPSHVLDRYANVDHSALLTDDEILEDIRIAYDNGFKGILSWHFYNEPTLELDRIERLYPMIKGINGAARFGLWTNGTLIADKFEELNEKRPVAWQRLNRFNMVIITNYEKRNWDWLKAVHPGVYVSHGRLDHRTEPAPGNRTRCRRIDRETIIDAYGNWRICCADFRESSYRMNIRTDGFQAIVDKYDEVRRLIGQSPQPENVPSVCYQCRLRG